MLNFIRQRLDPASRLGEILFGLIMALGFTASARLGLDESDNRTLFISILGCNVAWAIVDAVMYVLTALFERGRKVRLARDVLTSPSDSVAVERIAGELDQYLEAVTSVEERRRLYGHVVDGIRGRNKELHARIEREDLLGGLAVALIIVLATLPVVIPFLFGLETGLAVRISNAVAIGMLFLLGARWAAIIGASAWRIGSGLMCLGIVLVLITIALGG
jgi:hypothetical protein